MAYEFNHYYELQNVATGKYVNVLGNHEDGTVKNGETVNLFNRTNNPDQRWALENYGGNGNVRIVLQRGEGWYALNYNTRNANCIVWHLNTADDIDTVITAVQVESLTDTYYLKLRDRDTYLTADGTALKWAAYTGEKEQMFTILEPGTSSDGSDSDAGSDASDSKSCFHFGSLNCRKASNHAGLRASSNRELGSVLSCCSSRFPRLEFCGKMAIMRATV